MQAAEQKSAVVVSIALELEANPSAPPAQAQAQVAAAQSPADASLSQYYVLSLCQRTGRYLYANPSVVLKLLLFAIGLLAGDLYKRPSESCVISETCAKSTTDGLEHVFSSNTAREVSYYSYLLSGAIGFSGSNAYYSSRFVSEYIGYLNSFESKRAASLAGIGVILFGILQTGSPFFSAIGASLKTHGVVDEAVKGALYDPHTWIAVGGALPGLLFGSVKVFKMVSFFVQTLRWYIWSTCMSAKTPAEKADRDRMMYYMNTQPGFLKQLGARYQQVIKESKKATDDAKSTGKDILFKAQGGSSESNDILDILSKVTLVLLLAGGLYLVGSAFLPILLNSWNVSNILFSPALAGFMAAITSIGNTVSFLAVMIDMTQATHQVMSNLLTCTPIMSLAFQLFPGILVANVVTSTLTSILSYAVINTLFDVAYPPSWSSRDLQRHASRIGIDIYHAFALILFAGEALRSVVEVFYPNTKAHQYFQAEAEYNRYRKQFPDEFETEVTKKMTAQERDNFGLVKYEDRDQGAAELFSGRVPGGPDLVEATALSAPLLGDGRSRSSSKAIIAPQSSICAWCCQFSRSAEQVRQETPGAEMVPVDPAVYHAL